MLSYRVLKKVFFCYHLSFPPTTTPHYLSVVVEYYSICPICCLSVSNWLPAYEMFDVSNYENQVNYKRPTGRERERERITDHLVGWRGRVSTNEPQLAPGVGVVVVVVVRVGATLIWTDKICVQHLCWCWCWCWCCSFLPSSDERRR